MKELFTKILERVKAKVPEIRWTDKDKGQLSQYGTRPALAWPCMLLSLNYPNINTMDTLVQEVPVRVTMRIAFDFTGHTNSAMEPSDLQKS